MSSRASMDVPEDVHKTNDGSDPDQYPSTACHRNSPTILSMAEGDGEESYSRNSKLQAALITLLKSALDKALERVILPSDGSTVIVADLGSSSGPNSIDLVADIVDKLRQRLPQDAAFQAFFNDLPSNDFNNLFQLLSNDRRAKNFYTAGVPGSFYDRLFPESYVHIFNSSNSLHWLSTIPDAIVHNESPECNRGKTWIIHPSSAVAKAYQKQALLDLKDFLLIRAAELVSGGLLFFFCNGRSNSEPNEPSNGAVEKFSAELDEVLTDLVAEGLVTEQQRDTFNIPIYNRSMEDLTEALAYCGSMFDVVTAEVVPIDLNTEVAAAVAGTEASANGLSRKIQSIWKAVLSNLLEAHFGRNVAEVIWERYQILLDHTPRIGLSTLWICIVALIRT